MTRLAYISEYVNRVLPLFRLESWDVEVLECEKDEDEELDDDGEGTGGNDSADKAARNAEKGDPGGTYAMIIVEDKSRGATLFIYPGFWRLPLSGQQRYLAHELSHIVTAPYAYDALSLLPHVRSGPARKTLSTILLRREEILTDEIALMMLPRLPAYTPPT